ncbi:HS12A-like protein [Mya arenaria]|uniref:HS12A-like protein n=1 Tax=Mya arenaria TaxID=6604 RepID=A0ABY7DJM6_MYAAR|nr:HS12A-like protein [Mya arenaria]
MSRDAVVVAAIDFGTTYSGWAFSFKHEFKSDPIKVSAKTWTGGQLVSSKGPTCVLIKPDGRTLAAFGYEAESRYADLAEEEKHVNWFFFRRFKMMLYGKIGMQRDILLKDATGKELPAKTVFSLSAPVLKTFMTQHMDDYIDIFRDFEIKKRDVAPSRDNKVTFRIPIALLDVFYDMTDETLKQVIPQTRYAGMITLTGDKMRIDASVVKSFFKESVDSIVEHLGNLFREPSVAGCAAIVMVGGFSESPMLQETIKIQFPDVRVIIPDEAGLAILKGAVIFGHCPNIISERISKYTYGVACSQTYMQGIHPPDRKTLNEDGEEEVDDIFSVHVRAGQKLDIDEVQTARTYSVGQADQQAMTIQFFATDKTDPMFVDDPGCNRIGIMQVPVPGFGCDRQAKISLKFGKTEIEASVKIVHTSDVSKANINFLG